MKDLREQLNLPLIPGTRVVLMGTTDKQRQRDAHILIMGKTIDHVARVIDQLQRLPDTVYCEFMKPYPETEETSYGFRHFWQSMGVIA